MGRGEVGFVGWGSWGEVEWSRVEWGGVSWDGVSWAGVQYQSRVFFSSLVTAATAVRKLSLFLCLFDCACPVLGDWSLLFFPGGAVTTLQDAVAWEDEARRTTDPGAPVPSPEELMYLAERGEGVVSPPQVNVVYTCFGPL